MINTENLPEVFNFYPAQGEFKGIISIPHSGEVLPDEFKPYLFDDEKALAQDIDFRVHHLIDIDQLRLNGISILYSNIIRTAIDLNRPKEKACLNWISNSKGIKIVKQKPTAELEKAFLEKYYSPYYEMLKTLILELQRKTKLPSFIDLHSMPTKAEEYHLKINPHQDIIRPNFCLSDQRGKTCTPNFIQNLKSKLIEKNYSTKVNDPYFGGNVTQFLDKTYSPLNNIQVLFFLVVYSFKLYV